jgi:uncharacterized delta-60 repeat protein
MLRRAALAVVLAFFLFVPSAAALPGDPDTSFSLDGKATTNFTTGFDSVSAVLIQSDDKIVAVGMAAGSGGRIALARYMQDGSIDTSFGAAGTGRVLTNLTSGFDAAFDGTLDAAGNIVAVGRAGLAGGRFSVVRYTPAGALDTTFGGGDGKVLTDFTTGDDFAFGVAIEPLGEKIIAVGRGGGNGGRIALARYLPDGTLDTSFGAAGNGKVMTNITSGDDRADAVDLSGGKILVGGTVGYFGSNARFVVAQYDASGAPDTSFSGDGRVVTDFTTGFDGAFGIVVQSDGKIVAAGQAGGTAGLARYDAAGALDPTFGGDGKVTTNYTSGADYFDDIVLDGNGKLVAAGAANFFGPNARFALARYDPVDGSLDAAFGGGDGKVTTDFTTGLDGAYGVAIASGGELVAGGYSGGSGGRFALARYAG